MFKVEHFKENLVLTMSDCEGETLCFDFKNLIRRASSVSNSDSNLPAGSKGLNVNSGRLGAMYKG